MMTIRQCRELLGEEAEERSDEQIAEMRANSYVIATCIIDLLSGRAESKQDHARAE